jgi:hypothetical protein
MRASLFGRWVGRAAIFAALAFGALVAGGVASASAYVDNAEIPAPAPAVSGVTTEGVLVAFSYDWD